MASSFFAEDEMSRYLGSTRLLQTVEQGGLVEVARIP